MAAPTRNSSSWERVLAAMEADAARAAALLMSDDASAAAGIEYDGQDAVPPIAPTSDGVPATWRLPAAPVAAGVATEAMNPSAAARAVAGYAAVHAPNRAPVQIEPEPEQFVLPDPATMPSITPEERERLEALNSRIEELKAQLVEAMAEAENVLARATPHRAPAEPRPEFVDRRL